MVRSDKAAAVAELADAFRSADAAVLTEYRGLTVAQLAELRRSLGEQVTYRVVKNTLTKIAAKDAGVDAFEGLFEGPSAIAFVRGDPVEAAKSLRDFAKANPPLVIKGGLLEGRSLSPAELTRLADLESREVLLSRLAGALQASLAGAAALFQAPLTNAARLTEALRAKVEKESGGGPPPESAAEETTEPTAEETTEPTAEA